MTFPGTQSTKLVVVFPLKSFSWFCETFFWSRLWVNYILVTSHPSVLILFSCPYFNYYNFQLTQSFISSILYLWLNKYLHSCHSQVSFLPIEEQKLNLWSSFTLISNSSNSGVISEIKVQVRLSFFSIQSSNFPETLTLLILFSSSLTLNQSKSESNQFFKYWGISIRKS